MREKIIALLLVGGVPLTWVLEKTGACSWSPAWLSTAVSITLYGALALCMFVLLDWLWDDGIGPAWRRWRKRGAETG